jgi:hypothetical protein
MIRNFEVGKIYKSNTRGYCTFLGIDDYMGQRTFCFDTEYGKDYFLPETLDSHFGTNESDTIDTLKAENERLREALEKIRDYDPKHDPDIEDMVDATFKLMGIAHEALREDK